MKNKKKIIIIVAIALVVMLAVTLSLVAGVYKMFLSPADFTDYIIPVSGDGTGYYRYCYEELNESEKKIYSIVLEQIPSQPEKIEVPQLQDGDLNKVFKALSYDNPQLFNMGLNCRLFTQGQKSFFEVDYTMDSATYQSRLAEVENIANVIVEGASQHTSDYEKEKYVHDYIINHCVYVDAAEGSNANNIYGCLVEGKASCEGYSRAFQYLLSKLDISNRIVTGEAASDGVNYIAHMWNFVWLDDKGYFVDVTWDDPKGDSPLSLHTYFNVNTNDILIKHRNIEQPIPLTTEVEYNYYVYEATYLQIGSGDTFETAVSNAVYNALYNSQNCVEFRFPNGAVAQQARNSLFNTGVIYNVYTEAGVFTSSGSGQVYYVADDAMNTICLFF